MKNEQSCIAKISCQTRKRAATLGEKI